MKGISALILFFIPILVDAAKDNRESLIPGMIFGLYVPLVGILMVAYYTCIKKHFASSDRVQRITPAPRTLVRRSQTPPQTIGIAHIERHEITTADGGIVEAERITYADSDGNFIRADQIRGRDNQGNEFTHGQVGGRIKY